MAEVMSTKETCDVVEDGKQCTCYEYQQKPGTTSFKACAESPATAPAGENVQAIISTFTRRDIKKEEVNAAEAEAVAGLKSKKSSKKSKDSSSTGKSLTSSSTTAKKIQFKYIVLMPWGTKINKGTRRRELAGVTDMTPKIDDIRDAVLKGFAAVSDDEGGFSINAKLSSKGLGKFMRLQFPELWKAVVDDPHADDPDEPSWFLCSKSGKALRVLGGRENPNAGDLSESLVVGKRGEQQTVFAVPRIGCSIEFVQKKTGMSHGLFLGQYMKGEEDSDDERPAGSRGRKRKSRVTSDEESSDDNSSGKRRVKKEGLFLKAPSDDELDREIEDGLSNSHNFKLRSSTKRSASQHLEKQEPNSPIDLTQEDDNVNGSDSGSTHFEEDIEQEELECSSSPVVPKPDAFAQLLGTNSYFSP
ncbi:hypothetical protein C8J56DRAFT_1052909 [Mycena floridula]|nr:hypothetical protein C8J56DRAFT_1052909 [Mycena floridula]